METQTNEFEVQQPESKAVVALNPMALMERAIEQGLDAAQLAVIMELQLRWESNEARKRFEEAFEQFKRNAPVILKTRHVSYANSNGTKTDYWHAELDKICDTIGECLLAQGITQNWESSEENGRPTVTCILKGHGHTHRGAQLSGPPDTSGGKNNIQAIGSTASYLSRYTLCLTTGCVPKGMMTDDDGKTDGLPENTITDYCVKLQDAASLEELKPVFAECWGKAKHVNDSSAMGRFRKVYETRKRELL